MSSRQVTRRRPGGWLKRVSAALEQQLSIARSVEGGGRRSSVEAFRAVRLQLGPANGAGAQIVSVTSAVRGEGKSTVAAGLASVLARDGEPTLLVDADFYAAALHERLALPQSPGLAELLRSTSSGSDAGDRPAGAAGPALGDLVRTTGSGLDVLVAGGALSRPADLYVGPRIGALVALLRASPYRFVVIDSPAVLETGGAVLLAASADDVLVAVRAGVSRERDLRQARVLLEQRGAPLRGVVITEANELSPRDGPSSTTGVSARVASVVTSALRRLTSRGAGSVSRARREARDGAEHADSVLGPASTDATPEGQLSR